MLSFKHNKGRFNYRAAGVLIAQQRVLIHRTEHDDFWSLPGGRVEFGEPAHLALERELLEEIGVTVKVERLLWIVENFFTYQQQDYHELGFYFLANIDQDCALLQQDQFYGDENGFKLIFQWQPLDQIAELNIYPTFLKQALLDLPQNTQYVVHRD